MDQKWLETCINAGELLYGEFPMDVLLKLYATKGEKVTKEQVMEFYDSSLMMLCDGKMFTPLIVTEGEVLEMFKEADAAGNPYASLHFDMDELQTLRKEHSLPGLDYWIPKASQIEELIQNGFIRTPQFKALERTVESHEGDPSELPSLWAEISTGKIDGMEVVQEIISRTGMKFRGSSEEDLSDINSSVTPMMNFVNQVNKRDRKGWPPEELFRKTHPHGLTQMPTIMPGSAHAAQMMKQAEPQLRAMGANVDYSSIDSFATVGPYGERRVIKVGRNDPCPCGSGKKYKQCHGRNV